MSLLDKKTSIYIRQITSAGENAESAIGGKEAVLHLAGYTEGDSLEFGVTGSSFLWVDAVPNRRPCLLYLPAATYRFSIPPWETARRFAGLLGTF